METENGKIELKLRDGERGMPEGYISAEFSVGEIYPADKMVMRFGGQGTMVGLKESMKHKAREGQSKDFDNTLEEYCRMWLMEHLGVSQFPLKYKSDGSIDGLAGEYAIVNELMNKGR